MTTRELIDSTPARQRRMLWKQIVLAIFTLLYRLAMALTFMFVVGFLVRLLVLSAIGCWNVAEFGWHTAGVLLP